MNSPLIVSPIELTEKISELCKNFNKLAFIIDGISGSGKSYIANNFMNKGINKLAHIDVDDNEYRQIGNMENSFLETVNIPKVKKAIQDNNRIILNCFASRDIWKEIKDSEFEKAVFINVKQVDKDSVCGVLLTRLWNEYCQRWKPDQNCDFYVVR